MYWLSDVHLFGNIFGFRFIFEINGLRTTQNDSKMILTIQFDLPNSMSVKSKRGTVKLQSDLRSKLHRSCTADYLDSFKNHFDLMNFNF